MQPYLFLLIFCLLKHIQADDTWHRVYGNASSSLPGSYIAPLYPSSRIGAVWEGTSGGVVLAYGSSSSRSFQDVWFFNLTTSFWSLLWGDANTQPSGSNNAGSYGNYPADRSGALSWVDKNGNVVVYGGSSTSGSVRADFSIFNITSKQWSVASPLAFPTGVSPSYSSSVNPGSRVASTTWYDSSSNSAYLFGGKSSNIYSDIFRLDLSTKTWSLVYGGASTVNAAPNCSNSSPGARYNSYSFWNKATSTLWMYGGMTINGLANDLWKWTNAGGWKCVQGMTAQNAMATFSRPGARQNGAMYQDQTGRLFIALGSGFNSTTSGHLDDVWSFTPSNGLWAQVYGTGLVNTVDPTLTSSTRPYARSGVRFSVDPNTNTPYIFGGNSAGGYLGDVFSFAPPPICQKGVQSPDGYTCICESGYGNSAACSTPNIGQCVSHKADPLLNNDRLWMNQEDTKYVNNTFFAKVNGNFLSGRQFISASFYGATSPSCSLGNLGSFWSATTSTSNCSDVFLFALPWVNHTQCGFAVDDRANSDFLTYKAVLTVLYIDWISEVSVYRNSSASFMLEVNFPKMMELTFSNLTVVSEVSVGTALLRNTYNANTKAVTITFSSSTDWPNMLVINNSYPTVTLPTGISLSTLPALNTSSCRNIAGSQCREDLSFSIILDDPVGCSFDGLFTINLDVVTCRDPDSGCTRTPFYSSFQIMSSDVCGQVILAPTVQGQLVALSDIGDTNSSEDRFDLGSLFYFYADVKVSGGNTFTIQFLNLSFVDVNDTIPNPQFLLLNGERTALGGVNGANVKIHNDERWASVNITSKVFLVPTGSNVTYTFYATLGVVFSGNRRRTVDVAWSSSGVDASVKLEKKLRVKGPSAPSSTTTAALEASTMATKTTPQPIMTKSLPMHTVIFIIVGIVAFTVVVISVSVAVFGVLRIKLQKRMEAQAAHVQESRNV